MSQHPDDDEPLSEGLDVVLAPAAQPQGEPTTPDALVGTVIGGRYRVEGLLARGGMGWIFRAVHDRLGKTVALKVLLRPDSEEARLRFQREARLMCRVRHPLIVSAEDFGETADGQPYLVLEFQDGPTLAQEIRRGGPINPARTVSIALQIVDALDIIHRQGIIHRDLKPSNVFLVLSLPGRDVVRIGDFGLARSIQPGNKEDRLTVQGAIMGTPEYMAPEQAMGQDATEAADQYALGCTVYEMLTGSPPFVGHRPLDVVMEQIVRAPPPLRSRAPHVSPSLEAVVMRLLAKEPANRYPSLNEVRMALSKL